MPDRLPSAVVSDLQNRVQVFSRESALLQGGSSVLLAVSGGPDSLALLSIMAQRRFNAGLRPIVAYIDHGVRPTDEIASECAFVKAQANAAGLAFVTAKVEPVAERGRSPEEALRRGRYRALARLAAQASADRVATGHTRSDQAETVLLRLLRGTGLNGLAAMRPSAPWPLPVLDAPLLVRPLLCVSRAETVAYCAALGLIPRMDPENSNLRYRRNQVRAGLMPVLAAFNPRIEETLAALADETRLWRDALTQTSEPPVWRVSGDDVVADLAALRRLDLARRTLVLRAMLAAGRPEQPPPSRAHLHALERLLAGGPGARVSLPRGRLVIREYDALRLTSRAPAPARLFGPDRPVTASTEFVVGGWRIRAWPETVAGEALVHQREWWRFRMDPALAEGLAVGGRRKGDRIAIRPSGHATLQNLFVNAQIPRADRESWPIFRTEDRIVWVPGVPPASWAGITHGPALVLDVAPEPRGSWQS